MLTDWNLPRMNRLELVDKIRAKDQFDALPTIITTTCGNKKDIVATIKSGVDNNATQPVKPDELQDNIAKACKKRGGKRSIKFVRATEQNPHSNRL